MDSLYPKPTDDEMIIFIRVAEYLGQRDNQYYNSMYLTGFMFSILIFMIVYLFNPSLLSYQAKSAYQPKAVSE
jgi:hypothetical protein